MSAISHISLTVIFVNSFCSNKFINVSFEGVANPIYMDDPQQHKTDFPISPKWYTADNMFVNIIKILNYKSKVRRKYVKNLI